MDLYTTYQPSQLNNTELGGYSVQTPTKKTKAGSHSNIKTAQSPNMPHSEQMKPKLSIADIDAQELFENFNQIVKITQSTEKFEPVNPFKALQFDQEKTKLNFQQSTNSMRKKRKGSRLNQQYEDCIKIKPFIFDQDQQENQSSQKQSTLSHEKDLKSHEYKQNLKPEQTLTAMKLKNTRLGIMTTPTKKPVRKEDLELAAKKECPFRELDPKRNLFG